MDEAPISEAQARNLRYLRILVTTLTVTMIFGLLSIVGLLVIRFTGDQVVLTLPDTISLPGGAVATAFTQGLSWYGVVTGDDQILIFDRETGALIQTITINSP